MSDAAAPLPPAIEFAEFLEDTPPGSVACIATIGAMVQYRGLQLLTPDIQLYCDSDQCAGRRFFYISAATEQSFPEVGKWELTFLTYFCRNCRRRRKTFAVMYRATEGVVGEAYKIGEYPPFGPPLPARLISLVGPDREAVIRGRRSESQGLGVGAFAYYRRVVENQWKRFIEEIVRVAERIGASEPSIETLRQAAKETQFSRAVELAKDAIPDLIRIDGHNPITLLHSALSEGLHEQSEEHCLELASSIRVVLTELADRISQALKDERELKDAVGRLLNRHRDTP